MEKKWLSVAGLWLALIALVFIYTDRNEYTWRYEGDELGQIVISSEEADARQTQADAAMALEQQAAQARTDANLWGTDEDSVEPFRQAQNEDGGLNLTWGRYEVTVDYDGAAKADVRVVSAGYQAFIENGEVHEEMEEENGRFESRRELLKVAKLGPKAFEQCAGFMRITGDKNPLDGTSVHPESYEAVEKLFAKLNMKTEQISEGPTAFFIKDYKKMAEEIGVGEITLRDIIKELQKPGRDPRDEMPRPILRTDVLDMKDLKVGMILKGTVRNVIDFGAFVDIGVHQDGLVHISQMTKRFIKHPLEAVSVGDIVEVKVISLDLAKKRIGLSMLLDK